MCFGHVNSWRRHIVILYTLHLLQTEGKACFVNHLVSLMSTTVEGEASALSRTGISSGLGRGWRQETEQKRMKAFPVCFGPGHLLLWPCLLPLVLGWLMSSWACVCCPGILPACQECDCGQWWHCRRQGAASLCDLREEISFLDAGFVKCLLYQAPRQGLVPSCLLDLGTADKCWTVSFPFSSHGKVSTDFITTAWGLSSSGQEGNI